MSWRDGFASIQIEHVQGRRLKIVMQGPKLQISNPDLAILGQTSLGRNGPVSLNQ